VVGECEEVVAAVAGGAAWDGLKGLAWRDGSGEIRVNGAPVSASFVDHPPLAWPDEWVRRHHHHHHRFDAPPAGPGAEVEASRGCPYSCTFCAKENFRDRYRRRDAGVVAAEVDRLLCQGAEYVYFIDEIFLPNRPLLEAWRQGAAVRRPDPDRPLEARTCWSCSAGPAACRSRRAWRA
jgi:radical SAM superfamily enzyme YgiQ (UPF0313 family)